MVIAENQKDLKEEELEKLEAVFKTVKNVYEKLISLKRILEKFMKQLKTQRAEK
ncbi:hypothetical protein [Baaleninema simplex]|uniref:hypothetical protein n=1 Tax=Baaleninema simplex TaxID=2862350 RepID=UPI00034D4AB8|nr:hypothetical protein [Baaleninema simplex]